MLAVGIPEYRLPKDVLNAEIAAITDLGVEIRLNTSLGKDVKTEQLLSEGYGAVLMATVPRRPEARRPRETAPRVSWKGLPSLGTSS